MRSKEDKLINISIVIFEWKKSAVRDFENNIVKNEAGM